jgi:hypothetical protein
MVYLRPHLKEMKSVKMEIRLEVTAAAQIVKWKRVGVAIGQE